MIVKDVMSKRISAAAPSTPVRDIWKIIFVKKVNAVPVVDAKGTLIGIIAKDDLLMLMYPTYEEYISDFASSSDFEDMEKKIKVVGSKSAKDIMSRRVVFTREDTPLMRALSRMIVRHVDQLPVLSSGDKVVGILTKGDVFYALFKKRLSSSFSK
jgi:CBS-domain-containing membrane protein